MDPASSAPLPHQRDVTDATSLVVEGFHSIPEDQRSRVSSFLTAVQRYDAVAPLSDQAVADFKRHVPAGFSALLFHLASNPDELSAYAQLASSGPNGVVEFALHPALRESHDLLAFVLHAAIREARSKALRSITLWVTERYQHLDNAITSMGFELERSVHQLGLSLPLDPSFKEKIAQLTTRPFKPGVDEASWLELNSRAFRGHPEQGTWTVADIKAREKMPWFDPDGFLLAENNGVLMGACWMKIHHEMDPVTGEIYVISVDPSYHHHGIGKALTISGLSWLEKHRISKAMLYVDANNEAALSLYRSIGFKDIASRSAYKLSDLQH